MNEKLTGDVQRRARFTFDPRLEEDFLDKNILDLEGAIAADQ